MVKLWRTQTPQEARSLGEYGMGFTSLAVAPAGVSSLLSGGTDGAARLWDTATGKARLIGKKQTVPVSAVAVAPDGQRCAVAAGPRITVHDTASGKPVRMLQGHSKEVVRLAFHPRARLLASASMDGTVKLWDLASGRAVRTFESTGPVRGAAFSPDGARLATGSSDHLVRIYDWQNSRLEQTLSGHTARVIAVAFDAEGRRLASGSSDRTACVWDVASGKPRLLLRGHSAGIADVAFSSDGLRLASGSYDRTVKLWDLRTGRLALTIEGHRGPVNAIAFGVDQEQTLVSASLDHTIRLWRAPRAAQ